MTFEVKEVKTPITSIPTSLEVWQLVGGYKTKLRAALTLFNPDGSDFDARQRALAEHIRDYLTMMEGGS